MSDGADPQDDLKFKAYLEMSPSDRGEAIEAGAGVVRSIELPD